MTSAPGRGPKDPLPGTRSRPSLGAALSAREVAAPLRAGPRNANAPSSANTAGRVGGSRQGAVGELDFRTPVRSDPRSVTPPRVRMTLTSSDRAATPPRSVTPVALRQRASLPAVRLEHSRDSAIARKEIGPSRSVTHLRRPSATDHQSNDASLADRVAVAAAARNATPVMSRQRTNQDRQAGQGGALADRVQASLKVGVGACQPASFGAPPRGATPPRSAIPRRIALPGADAVAAKALRAEGSLSSHCACMPQGATTPRGGTTPRGSTTPRSVAPPRSVTPPRRTTPPKNVTPSPGATPPRAVTPPRGVMSQRGATSSRGSLTQRSVTPPRASGAAASSSRSSPFGSTVRASAPTIRGGACSSSRSGSSTVGEAELKRTWHECATFHGYGKLMHGQVLGEERAWEVLSPAGISAADLPVTVSCTKGHKGEGDNTPNQDNFSVTYFSNGYAMVCCFDGHGPHGHFASTRAVQTVPYFLITCPAFPDRMEDALIDAFEKAHDDLITLSAAEGWDVQGSGTTAVAAVWHGSTVWTANSGDSRCVAGSEAKRGTLWETVDHKPEDLEERKRIEASGGEVRSQTFPDGLTMHRVYLEGESYPGLCMSRSLGDLSAKSAGVIATPDVCMREVQLANKPFLVLASDGVWEFIDSDFVTQAVGMKLQQDGPERRLQRLRKEARKRWVENECDYCDDITAIVVRFGSEAASTRERQDGAETSKDASPETESTGSEAALDIRSNVSSEGTADT